MGRKALKKDRFIGIPGAGVYIYLAALALCSMLRRGLLLRLLLLLLSLLLSLLSH